MHDEVHFNARIIFNSQLDFSFQEWDWIVLEYVLKTLPKQLRNKTLVLGGKADVTTLCALLCKMVSTEKPERCQLYPGPLFQFRFTKSFQ